MDFRPQAFEVLALGVRSGMLQFSTAQETTDWLSAVATNIHDLTLQRVKMANKCCSPRDQSKTYPCSWQGGALPFTVDFASGFTCCNSRTQELEFPDLTAVLHCVHAFLAVKVASLDPSFAGSQGLSRKPLGSS